MRLNSAKIQPVMSFDFSNLFKNEIKSISHAVCHHPEAVFCVSQGNLYIETNGKFKKILEARKTLERLPYLELVTGNSPNNKAVRQFIKAFQENDTQSMNICVSLGLPFKKISFAQDNLPVYLELLDYLINTRKVDIHIKDLTRKTSRPFVIKREDSISDDQKQLLNFIKKYRYEDDHITKILDSMNVWSIAAIWRFIDSGSMLKFLISNFDENKLTDVLIVRDRRGDGKKSLMDTTYKRQLINKYIETIVKNENTPIGIEIIQFLSKHYLTTEVIGISPRMEKHQIAAFIALFRNRDFSANIHLLTEKVKNAVIRIEKGQLLHSGYKKEMIRTNISRLTEPEKALLKIILLHFTTAKNRQTIHTAFLLATV